VGQRNGSGVFSILCDFSNILLENKLSININKFRN
jgi:hypothetical protein